MMILLLLLSAPFILSDVTADEANDDAVLDDILNSLLGEQNDAASSTGTPSSVSAIISTSTSSSTTTTTTASTTSRVTVTQSNFIGTTTTEDPKCITRDLLSKICNFKIANLLEDADIWDIYYMLFDDTVLERLLNCPSGTWCIGDEFDSGKAILMTKVDLIRSSDIFAEVCDQTILGCLQSLRGRFESCDISSRINFTESAVSLLCSIKDRSNFDVDCLKQLLASWHVSMTYLIEKDFKKVDQQNADNTPIASPNKQMIKTFQDTKIMCPKVIDKLCTFKPWQWFLSTSTDTCNGQNTQLDTSTALIDDGGIIPPSTMSPGSEKQTFQDEMPGAGDDDTKMLAGATAGAIFTFLVLVTLAIIFWRRNKMDESDKEGYKPLISHGP